MDDKTLSHILASINEPITDESFAVHAFSLAAKARRHAYSKDGDNMRRACAEEYDELSRRMDKTRIQESCAARNILRTRRLANLLINDEGELLLPLFPRIIKHLTAHLYFLGPDRQYDTKRQEHILRVLNQLHTSKELQKLLKMIGKPFSHKYADQIIRDTLGHPSQLPVTDAHTRRAALAAWLCYLRQSLGSCFATAPAIIVHDEQPERFLKDINEMLNTGRLKRTFEGKEYSVPISNSWGTGDLRRQVVFHKNQEDNKLDLWMAPGLLEALEAVNVIDAQDTLQQRIQRLKSLLVDMIQRWETNQPHFLMEVEGIIQHLLLQHLGITIKEVIEYENRPREMIHGGLLMHISRSPVASGGKGEVCALYLTQFEIAKNAFKAVVDNALLKSWEFTVASFAETKANFTRWNLYSSLGLGSQEEGGIGHCLFTMLKTKLDETNRKVQEYQQEYEILYPQLKYLEARFKSASTEQEMRWMKVEYQSKVNEFYTFEEMRDKTNHKAHRYANLYDLLIDAYDSLFPQYFQEVYDADIHDVSVGPYDDSPAGFRLLYKHGRANTSQWTYIKSPNDFIDALVNFFVVVESELKGMQNFQGLEEDLSDITTAIVSHLKTPLFLETAFHRMALAHKTPMIKNPLENLEKIEKKPWVYTSGGSMETLVSCYFSRGQKPTDMERWVENPAELLVFIIDTLKQQPYALMDEFIKNPQRSMLIHSPTHAFLLKPGLQPLQSAWQTEAFTYTWMRDQFIRPMERFLDQMALNGAEMDFIVQELIETVPHEYKHMLNRIFSHIPGRMGPPELRSYLDSLIDSELGIRYGNRAILTNEEIDSALYSMLPLFPNYELANRLKNLFSQLPGINESVEHSLFQLIDGFVGRFGEKPFIHAKQLQNIAKSLLVLSGIGSSTAIDYHVLISQKAQQLGYAFPPPIIFADTNWVKDEFGFLLNPGSGQFELWRLDFLGSNGSPMQAWKQWLNGSQKNPKWGIYSKKQEYRSA